MNIQPGDMVRISHEALLPNYLLGRTAIVAFFRKNGDIRVGVYLGKKKGTSLMRFRAVDVWKEEVEPISCK